MGHKVWGLGLWASGAAHMLRVSATRGGGLIRVQGEVNRTTFENAPGPNQTRQISKVSNTIILPQRVLQQERQNEQMNRSGDYHKNWFLT